ncbi:MAG: protein-disulfide reductase DsbD domain-containing protein, partial [Wenzhouxiangellaceae bacterium]
MSAQAVSLVRMWIAALLLAPLSAFSQIDPDDLLPIEQAFALSARMSADDRAVRIHWDVADGYYLYRHAFRVEPPSPGLALGEPQIPPGQRYADEFFGEVEIYRGGVEIVVPVEQRPESGQLALQIGFQGCADLGVCYPPQRQLIELALTSQASGAPDRAPLADPAPLKPSGLLDRLADFGKVGSQLTGRSEPLPAEQAFVIEAIALAPGQLLARFTVHPDYYLY